MKATINDSKSVKKREYPYIGISGDLIILFRSRYTGVVLSDTSIHYLGDDGSDWDEDVFKVFEGSITLSND